MTIDFFNAEIVESYLNNQLSAEDRKKFEKELKENKELSEFVSLYYDVDAAISEHDVMELRNSLNSIHEMAIEDWIEETPMLLTEPRKDEIDQAISEDDVMALRSMLSDIHDLHQEELHTTEKLSEVESVSLEELNGIIAEETKAEQEDLFESDIYKAIMEEDVMELRNKLESIGEKVKAPAKRKPIYQRISRLTAVASIALIVILGATSWYALDSKPMNPERALVKYFEPLEPVAAKRGVEDDELKQLKINGHEKYRDKDFLGALDEYKDYVIKRNSETPDNEATSYIGSCYLATGQYDKAQKQFEIIYADKGSAWIEKAQWYLAGCYLRNEDLKNEAIKMFKEMAMAPDHEYKENSRKLLKKLKI